MEFVNMFAKIGEVKQNCGGGVIKAKVPSLFDDEDLSKLPEIIYCPFGAGNSFGSPVVGENVLVIGDHSDPLALFWVPINETSVSTNMYKPTPEQTNITMSEDSSVLVKKPLDGGTRYAEYFIDSQGCHIKDGSTEILVSDSDGITIKGSNIVIGDGGSNIKIGSGSHQIARADLVDAKVTSLSAAIIQLTSLIQKAAATSPMTSNIAAGLVPMQETITKLQADIESTGSGIFG